ncbi:hypothetical protein CNEO_170037 [Clostridium neonatale]|uniref:hypothetical protein n=1 Tax=Clostridium neonatale TaxID=137838 RepID=UPI001DF8E137|nr:hypothetical protein [Clostridium neonatale]CAG9702577.1 hypothetical protein CNEO_170037 [Clostridium neonatale]
MLAYCYDKNGYFTEVKTVEKLEENQTNKPILTGYCKPRFINNSWVEGATQEEIEKERIKNTISKSSTSQDEINAQLLEEIAQQKIVNTQLMQEIATLKGGSTNV